MFRVTDLKILGRIGTHFFEKNILDIFLYILCILKVFSRKPEKSRFHQ